MQNNRHSYALYVFPTEFMISFSINLLPFFNLPRLAVAVSLSLFAVHTLFSVVHYRRLMSRRNRPVRNEF